MIVLQLSGEEMGAVVGRRGDNLDAMQYLASLVANKSEGSYVRVVLISTITAANVKQAFALMQEKPQPAL